MYWTYLNPHFQPTFRLKQLIEYHKHPIIKVNISGTKFFSAEKSEEEKTLTTKNLNALLDVLRSERVERRCARSKGHYLMHKNLIQLSKIVGLSLAFFGNQTKNGVFLSSKEALFLLETVSDHYTKFTNMKMY